MVMGQGVGFFPELELEGWRCVTWSLDRVFARFAGRESGEDEEEEPLGGDGGDTVCRCLGIGTVVEEVARYKTGADGRGASSAFVLD